MKTVLLRHRLMAFSTTFFLITFPVFFYYLSPAIPMAGAFTGVITGSLIVFGSLFVISLFSGRWFCSYICPAGTIQDLLSRARTSLFPIKYFRLIKYIVWLVWAGILAALFIRAGGVSTVSFSFATIKGISVSDVNSLIIYLIVAMVFVVMPLVFGRRAACHTICWMAPFMTIGRRIGRLVKIPSVMILSRQDECISCGRCNSVCPMSLEVQALQSEGGILSVDCILCGKCVDSCPRKVLYFGFK